MNISIPAYRWNDTVQALELAADALDNEASTLSLEDALNAQLEGVK